MSCLNCDASNAEYACSCDLKATYCSDVCHEIHWNTEHWIDHQNAQTAINIGSGFFDDVPQMNYGTFWAWLKASVERTHIIPLLRVLGQLSIIDTKEKKKQILQFLYNGRNGDFQNVFGVTKDAFLNTLFVNSAKLGYSDLVKMQIEVFNQDPTVYDDAAIRMASAHGRIEVVRLLLGDKTANPAADDNYAIRSASYNGHTEVVRLLLDDERIDPAADDNEVIHNASANGHIEIVRLLLDDERVDPAAGDNDAVCVASENGYTEIVRLLLGHERVDPAGHYNLSIVNASENGHTEIVRLLLDDKRVDPARCHNLSIINASKNGHTEIVRLLLDDKRVDPVALNNLAIRGASENGHTEVVRLLLNYFKHSPGFSVYDARQLRNAQRVPENIKDLLDKYITDVNRLPESESNRKNIKDVFIWYTFFINITA